MYQTCLLDNSFLWNLLFLVLFSFLSVSATFMILRECILLPKIYYTNIIAQNMYQTCLLDNSFLWNLLFLVLFSFLSVSATFMILRECILLPKIYYTNIIAQNMYQTCLLDNRYYGIYFFECSSLLSGGATFMLLWECINIIFLPKSYYCIGYVSDMSAG